MGGDAQKKEFVGCKLQQAAREQREALEAGQLQLEQGVDAAKEPHRAVGEFRGQGALPRGKVAQVMVYGGLDILAAVQGLAQGGEGGAAGWSHAAVPAMKRSTALRTSSNITRVSRQGP